MSKHVKVFSFTRWVLTIFCKFEAFLWLAFLKIKVHYYVLINSESKIGDKIYPVDLITLTPVYVDCMYVDVQININSVLLKKDLYGWKLSEFSKRMLWYYVKYLIFFMDFFFCSYLFRHQFRIQMVLQGFSEMFDY